MHLFSPARDFKDNNIIAFCFAPSELDLNRLDGDTVCPPMRSGQDDLPGTDLKSACVQTEVKQRL